MMKPILFSLRRKGIRLIIYLDDALILADSETILQRHVEIVLAAFQELGFMVNFKKSVLNPQKEIEYLGRLFNSNEMIISLPNRKINHLISLCRAMINSNLVTLQEIAEFQGSLIAACPAVNYGLLFTRILAKFLADSLAAHSQDYTQLVSLPSDCKQDIQWWLEHLSTAFAPIRSDKYDMEIFSDASLTGYGFHKGKLGISGHWRLSEITHINRLELLAAERALHHFCKDESNKQILLRLDSQVAIAYINRMGGVHSEECFKIAKRIWVWAIERNLWLYASYIYTQENVIADQLSRLAQDDLHWKLDPVLFKIICKKFGTPSIDLFACYENKQLSRYVSWKPSVNAAHIDAFTLNWKSEYGYAFPPFG